MRAFIAKPGSIHVGSKCRLCGRSIKARQSIVVDIMPERRFGTGTVNRWHTACLRRLVDGAPDGIDELNARRDEIVAAGDAFV